MADNNNTNPPNPNITSQQASDTNRELLKVQEQEKAILAAILQQQVERQKSIEYLKEQEKTLKEQLETVDILAKASGNYAEQIRKTNELAVIRAEIVYKEAVDNLKNLKTTEDRVAAEERLVAAAKAYNEEQEKQKNNLRALEQGNTLAKLLGINESNQNSLTYQMFKNPKTVMKGFSESLSDAGGAGSAIGLSLLMKVQEATVKAFYETDAAISSFVAATGASAAYNNVIVGTARGNTALGISFKEAGKAVTDLYTGLNTFTKLNQSAQQELTITTAKLEKLGISGGETAKSIATLSEMMGVSEVQAAKVVEEFAAMGQAIGVASRQMISDFVGVKDQLAVFGNDMNKVFTDLAAQSKATGVAVGDLLNLANKFDTFSSAADSVGKLNAMLGGPYLSTMAMIEATDPTERIDMLRQAVDNAGVAFDEMSYYEKKAIMEAGGFKTVEEAQRVLSMSAGDYAKQLENQRASQEELNSAIQRAQPIQEKLSLIMANFAIVLGPVVEILSSFLSVIARIMDNEIMMALIKALIIFGGIMGAIATGPIGIAIASITALVMGLFSLHDALLVPHSPVLLFALMMLPDIFDSIGNAAYNIADAISITADSFLRLHDAVVKNPEAFVLLAGAMAALSTAMTVGVVGGVGNKLASIFNADLASQIEDIADAVSKFDETKLLNFKVVMEKAVEVSNPEVLSGFESFKDNFEAIVKATAEFEVKKAQSFTNLLTATQNLSQNLQLKQDIKVLVDSQAIAARIEKKQGNAAIQGV